MGAEKDWARTGSMKYTRVEDQSSVKDSHDADNNTTGNSMKIPSALSVPPRGITEQSGSKSLYTTVTISPLEIKGHNGVAVSAAADVAANRFVRQQLQWKATIKAFSSFLSRLSPAAALKKARDCYVRSLSNFATQLSSSAACGVTYGVGHNSLDKIPTAWYSGSQRYREETPESDTCLSSAFKQSLKETHISQSCRTFGSIPQIPPATASRYCRVSSGRVYSSSRSGMLAMPIYTIKETT